MNKIADDNLKKKLKKKEFRFKRKLVEYTPKITEDKLYKIFYHDFGLRSGDNVFVHSSMAMIHTDLKDEDVFNILMGIVGEKGSITVPCYPPMSSEKYMLSRKKFNVDKAVSGMGSFSEYVRKHEKSVRSFHPTKSVASIGIDKSVLYNHYKCEYPFGKGSPYEHLVELGTKVIGIGVSMNYLSFVHIPEDMEPNSFPLQVNLNKIFKKKAILPDSTEVEMETLVHDMDIVTKANPEKFVKRHLNKKDWVCKHHYFTPLFMVTAKPLVLKITEQANSDVTIYS
ncbi:AAC(3) family N-acetyltransferase [Vibrio breoganii]|uniref:AAC(3) family N-acetyltransferase n=1 Tax=Vibrio breoganii TaxID=553239 RepID=UPI0012FFFF84|nr:AAC(3) family N-acetyltransferase [Vibrio breoganii]